MLKKSHTYEEILGQAETLAAIFDDIVNGTAADDFFRLPYDEMILFGCGTDYNLCQSAAFYGKALIKDKNFIAVPSSELLLNTEIYINKNRKYTAVGFSRSGQTTESIDVLKKLKRCRNVSTFVFSARKNSPIIKLSERSLVCNQTREKSIAMTKAYTGFLFAYCLILAKYLNKKEMIRDFGKLVDFFKANIQRLFSEVESLYLSGILDFNRYFVLGSGFDYGIAVEADLKMKEMARTDAYSYHLHEFIHGPKTLVDSKSLCLVLASGNLASSVAQIAKELLGFGSRILTIGNGNILNIQNPNIHDINIGIDFKSSFVKSFVSIPVFQILAYLRAVKKGFDPDNPVNLNFTTKLKIKQSI